MSRVPTFTYYPGAYDDGCLSTSDTACPVCGRQGEISYRGRTFGPDPDSVDRPCVHCIADGRAAAAANIVQDWPEYDPDIDLYYRLGAFGSIAMRSPIPNTDAVDEILNRTPWPSTWQQLDWPLSQDEPMIFEGFVDFASVQSSPPRLAALVAACPQADVEWCKSKVTIGGDINVMMFRSRDGTAFTGLLDAS